MKIYILSRPTLELDGIVAFLKERDLHWLRAEEVSSAEEIVEVCGRICYMSFSNDQQKIRYPNSEYIKNLITKGHESVLEHVSWTFIIDGISRSLSHQLVRHRIGFSYSQLSQQYHEDTYPDFVEPRGIGKYPDLLTAWRAAVQSSADAYRSVLKALKDTEDTSDPETRREVRSAARSLLPNATATTIAVTVNCRALRHFFATRGEIIGDPEMRSLAVKIFRIVSREAPSLFSDFDVADIADGIGVIRKTTSHAVGDLAK